MRNLLGIALFIFCISLSSCRKDFGTILSTGQLEFSVDTLLLNRVFDDISSSTKNFTVYNRSSEAISIPNIKLERGESSFYRLNVDGVAGKTFQDITILPNDSIFVFVEATVDFNQVTDSEFFYRDKVLFDAGVNEQKVELEALVLDVVLIRPDRTLQPDGSFTFEEIVLGQDAQGEVISVRGTLIDDNTNFTNEKPYLIYGYVGVPANLTLTLEAGSTLYFHKDSGLLVEADGSLQIEGELGNEVLLEDDRLEPEFEDVAGQWGTIWLRAGSKNSSFNYAVIKNNIIGVLVDSISNVNPTLTLRNTQIYNNSNFGILGRETNIEGENLVIGNNGLSSLACTVGGSYNFTHCTFANYWNSGFRQFPTLLINNFFTTIDEFGNETAVPRDLLAANFTNCIVDGNQNVEFILDKVEGGAFNYSFMNSMLQFDTNNSVLLNDPLFDFTNAAVYENIILNGIAQYRDVSINDYIIGQDSDANANADLNAAQSVPFDILNISRLPQPDIGAYQHIIFEEEN